MFNVIYNAIGLLVTIFSFRFQKATTYYLSKYQDLLGEVVTYSMLTGLFAIGCVLVVSFAFKNVFYHSLLKGIDRIPWFILVLVSASSYLWNLIINLLPGLLLFKLRSFFMGGSYLLKSILVILSIGLLKTNLNGLIFVMGSVETIIYLMFMLLFLPRIKLRFNLLTFISMFKYSVASFPGLLSDKITLGIDVFFINYFGGASQVGIYSVAISVSNMLLYVPKAIRSVLLPFIASHTESKITAQLSRLLILGMFFLFLLMIPAIWIAIPLFFGVEFSFSRVLFLLLAPGTAFWGIYVLISSDIEGRGFPFRVSKVSMISAVATIVLDLMLIPILGNAGASIVSSLTYGIAMLLIVHLYKETVGIGFRRMLIPQKEDFRLLVKVVRHVMLRP